MIFQLGVWLCSFHSRGNWSNSTAETSTWADTRVPKTTETEWKPHSQLGLGNEKGSHKGWCLANTLFVSLWSRPLNGITIASQLWEIINDPTKADVWKELSLSVSGADSPDAKSLGHHQMCSSDRLSPSSPPGSSPPQPRGRLGQCSAHQGSV